MEIGLEELPTNAELLDMFEGIVERADDLSPFLLAVVDDFHALEQKRFDANGPGWLPLAASTLATTGSWAREGNPDQILQVTGTLLDSLVGQGEGGFTELGPDYVYVGTDVPYAHWHQTGGSRTHPSGAGWPPKRPVVVIDQKVGYTWALLLTAYLFEGEEALGLSSGG